MGLKGSLAKLGAGGAASYIITSLMLLCSFYYFLIDISSKNKKTAENLSYPWLICSSFVTVLIFASSQVTSLLQPAAMGCALTLTASCIMCCCASSFSGIKGKR